MEKALGLEYEVHGEGEPVLLIHGGVVADAFLPLTGEAALADRYQLIRYRRRGFAGSEVPAQPFGVAGHAGDAGAPLEHLGVERAHVIGYSYGGAIALQLALDAPNVVGSLVLLEPPLPTAERGKALWEQAAPLATEPGGCCCSGGRGCPGRTPS